ncbi:putative RNA-directed DNA polymerase from transposon X-element [Araneus ventricosus]|uniref:Putative RNA-directed DNA polymerase from transposon X-element n=1 Tax=Araneus ventricosus TaxID=182803 RepID=A0A4Y2WC59_ARAVE|nr:putative RNA-directed DNA polymerase from transposon X-element [Araneus ventricosus]
MINLVQWNARGLRNKALAKDSFLKADIVAIQETFLTPSVNFALPNKILYRTDRHNSPSGGLLIGINKTFSSHLVNLQLPPSEVEVQAVRIVIESQSILIINIYSPHGNFESSFLENLYASLSPPFLIVGDFNIHHPILGSLRTSRSANVVLDWISTHNMCILNTSDPTYFKQGCHPSLLDLSICSPDLLYEIKWTVHNDTFDSDHCPIEISFNYGNTKGPSVRRRIHWGKFGKSLNSILDKENNIHSIQSFEKLCNQEKNNNTLIQDMFSKKFPPWWSSECSFLLGQKRKFLRLAKQSRFNPYCKRAKHIAAKLQKLILHLKRTYWDKLCDNAGSSKTSFRIIRSLRSRDIPQQNAHRLIVLEGSNLTSPLGKANAFGSMFGSSPISEGIPLDFSGTATPMDSKFSIRELLQSLPKKLNGSPGSDGITGRMLRCLTLVNLKKILSLVNEIWLSGNIPPSWKHSVIIPILKPGKNASELKSYRPISLTSVLCKTAERMICRRLTDFFLKENIFHPHHFGFLPFRSCESLHMMFFNTLLKARSNKEYILAASLDISSAYDSVWPDGVVYKTLQIGLSGHTARWIHEFLTNRTLQVRWSGKLSASFTSNRGVPQGCCIFRTFSQFIFMMYSKLFLLE